LSTFRSARREVSAKFPGVTLVSPQAGNQFLRVVGEDRWENSQPVVADVAGLTEALQYRTRRPATAVSNVANPAALSYPVVYKSAFGSPGDLLLYDVNMNGGGFLAGDGTYAPTDTQPTPADGAIKYAGFGTFFTIIPYPLTVPNVTLSVRIRSKNSVSNPHYIEIGFGLNSTNYVGCYLNIAGSSLDWELKDAGAGTTLNKGDGTTAAITVALTYPATIRIALNCRSLAFYWNDNLLGVAEIPNSKLDELSTR
jgi:hypothetical protein